MLLILLHAPDLVEARNRILAAEPDAEGVLRCVRWLLPAGQRVVSLWELGTTCDVPDDVPTRALMALEHRHNLWPTAQKLFGVDEN